MSDLKRSYMVKKAGATVVLRGVLMALKFVLLIVVIRAIGKEGWGVYALLISLGAQMNFFELGLGSFLVKQISGWGKEVPEDEANRLLSTTAAGFFCIAVAMAAVVVLVFFTVFDRAFRIPPDIAAAIGPAKLCVAGAFFVMFGTMFCTRILTGLHEFELTRLVTIATEIVQCLAVIVVISPSKTVAHNINLFAAISLAVAMATFVALWVAWRRKFPGAASFGLRYVDRSVGRQSAGFAWPLVAGKFLAFVMTRIDVWIVAVFLGPASAGVLDLAKRIYMAVTQLTSELSTTVFPFASHLLGAQKDQFKELFREATYYVFALTGAIAVAAAAMTTPVVDIFFGPAFRETAVLVWILLVGATVSSAARSGKDMILSMGKYRHMLKHRVVATVAAVALQLLLVQRFEATGVALGSALGMCVLALGFLWEENRWIPNVVGDALKALWKPVLFCLGSGAIAFGLLPLQDARTLAPTVGWGGCLAILMAAGFYVVVLQEKEKEMALDALRKVLRRLAWST